MKNPPANPRHTGSIPGSGRFSGGGNGESTPVFLPGKSHGQRSLMGYNSWGCKESDMTEVHDTHTCFPAMIGDIRAHKPNLFTNLLSFNAENSFKAFFKDLFQ